MRWRLGADQERVDDDSDPAGVIGHDTTGGARSRSVTRSMRASGRGSDRGLLSAALDIIWNAEA